MIMERERIDQGLTGRRLKRQLILKGPQTSSPVRGLRPRCRRPRPPLRRLRTPQPYRRTMYPTVKMTVDGSHTHLNSLSITRIPHFEKKLATPIGDTSIGLHGKKCLSLLNGANSAIPRPPFVSISSNECESVDINRKRKITQLPPGLLRSRVKVSSALSAAAKIMECVKPRCPSISP